MSGPVPMALGPFKFKAHGLGFTEMERKLDATWAELETAGRLNALQWTGPTSEVITIKGVAFPAEFGGEGTLNGIKMSARLGVPQILLSGGGRIYGLHAIEGVDEEGGYYDRKGAPARVGYSLKLRKIGFGFSLLSLLRGL